MEGEEGEEKLVGNSGGILPPNNRRREAINSILIIVIGVFALIFSSVAFLTTINNPFADILKQGAEADALAVREQQLALLADQTKDTDGDGLTDFDELNKYGTNPYLKDSDSDGIDDKSEVLRGTDPNCPEGQNCFNTVQTTPVSASTNAGATPTLNTAPQQSNFTITADYIRNLMIQNGVDKTQLSQVNDADLMAEFSQYLKDNSDVAAELAQAGVNVASVSQPPASAADGQTLAQPNASAVNLQAMNVKNVDDLKNLNGTQIRQLMIQAGASESLLSSVSDDQLKTMFIQQIESKTQQ